MIAATPTLPEQTEVQTRLQEVYSRTGGRLDETLVTLMQWSDGWGYFDHLKQTNEYLTFEAPGEVVPLRVQVNYSRLGYKAPEGNRGPACPLCFENIGVPGKERLRVFEFTLAGTPFFAHLTPFPLYRGHFVVNLRRHAPMMIGREGLVQSLDFVQRAPGWLVASNSDVEWAGASVLGHHHVQVFAALRLPVEDAAVEDAAVETPLARGEADAAVLRWHCPVVRVSGAPEAVVARAGAMIDAWKSAEAGKRTFNYLMRLVGDTLTVHLFYRHPDHRTPEHRRTIKAEGVGIIEMAGEVIVPPIKELDRAANVSFFREKGLAIVREIIRGNGPWPLFDAFRAQL